LANSTHQSRRQTAHLIDNGAVSIFTCAAKKAVYSIDLLKEFKNIFQVKMLKYSTLRSLAYRQQKRMNTAQVAY